MHSAAHRDVAVTGLGAVSALGDDCRMLWESVRDGRGGIRTIHRFSTAEFGVATGATVEGYSDAACTSGDAAFDLCFRFSERAAREAMTQAKLWDADIARDRISVVFGTGLVGQERPIHEIAEQLADRLNIRGPRLTVSTACSSSTGALGIGRDLIAMGAADVVLAGGADVLTPEVFAGFHALGVLTPTKCAPFSVPLGTTLGEGAGFAVLERGDVARDRKVRILVAFSGYGLSGDGWHETSPDPKGTGTARAIRGALHDAAVAAAEIEYVNAHGSGTEANDPAEWLGIQSGLGTHARGIPVSSTKGAIGHAQGAAGVLEVIVTILCMQHGLIPPTLNFAEPRRRAPDDPVGAVVPRAHEVHRALSVNAAFGGANAALILSRPNGVAPVRGRKPVYMLGLGATGAGGSGSEGDGTQRTLEALLPGADVRGLDPSSRLLTTATALALASSGVTVRASLRERVGLVVGQRCASPASLLAFHRSIEARGLAQLSAHAFARIVLNAAAGFCSKLLSLRGPLSAVTTGAGSGLTALVLALEILSTRDEVDVLVAGAVDESAPDGYTGTAGARDHGVCVALANAHGLAHASNIDAIEIGGWGIAGPDHIEAAIARAVAGDADAGFPYRRFRAEDAVGDGRSVDDATTSMVALADAVRAMRRGDVDRALVTSGTGRSASAAILLVASVTSGARQ